MPEKQYDPQQLELKWHERWNSDTALYQPEENSARPKYSYLEILILA